MHFSIEHNDERVLERKTWGRPLHLDAAGITLRKPYGGSGFTYKSGKGGGLSKVSKGKEKAMTEEV